MFSSMALKWSLKVELLSPVARWLSSVVPMLSWEAVLSSSVVVVVVVGGSGVFVDGSEVVVEG